MMADKPTRKSTPTTRNPKKIVLREPQPCEDEGEAQAREIIRPNINAAVSIQGYAKGGDLTGLIYALEHEIKRVNDGDLTRPGGMLVAQAHTLDMIFNALAQRANRNMEAGYLDATDRYMRLAFKAQSQCRTTLETLAEIKNPRSVAFVKQANFAHGSQQVNNGSMPEASRARENENRQSKLLESQHGERMDTGTTGAAIGIDKAMATLGEINGTKNQ
jgi:hypothetical protein